MNITRNLTILCLMLTGCAGQRLKTQSLPVLTDGRYSIKIGNQALEIDPAIGGRITALTLDGKNFLTDSTFNNANWGSTFWPSPQREWNWPPPPIIDNKPYTASVINNVLKMVSQKDPKFGWIVTKEISGNAKEESYKLKFTITNGSDRVQKVAPWEVTRVHTKGLTFFPIGGGERRGGLVPITVEKEGISWFTHVREKLPVRGDRQLYADGSEGWLAHINDDVILIKKFPDIPLEKNAPSIPGKNEEGEVELYASAVTDIRPGYVEIEHQGAYEELQPGASLTWEVVWYLRRLPAATKVEAGNRALVDLVRGVVK
jgi:hypothetical protein